MVIIGIVGMIRVIVMIILLVIVGCMFDLDRLMDAAGCFFVQNLCGDGLFSWIGLHCETDGGG